MYIDLIRSILRPPRNGPGEGSRWRSISVGGTLALVLAFGLFYAGTPADTAQAPAMAVNSAAGDAVAVADQGAAVRLADLENRVGNVSSAIRKMSRYYDAEVAPIRRVLMQYRDNPELAERVAVALVREANEVGLEPRLLLAVLLVENPWVDPDIRSPVGAIGLMQVMPLHRGAWADCEPDLEDIDANICHGARIFSHYFSRSGGDIERALLRYNGCVHGTNTPNCHQYPYHVFARAGRASVLAWLDTGPTSAR